MKKKIKRQIKEAISAGITVKIELFPVLGSSDLFKIKTINTDGDTVYQEGHLAEPVDECMEKTAAQVGEMALYGIKFFGKLPNGQEVIVIGIDEPMGGGYEEYYTSFGTEPNNLRSDVADSHNSHSEHVPLRPLEDR